MDDLDELPDDGNRYEIIDGELFVTPAPAWPHQRAAGFLYKLLFDYLEREAVGAVVIAPADVTFSHKSRVQPDVFVVPLVNGRHPQRFEDVGHLMLAVEVLSPSTARADRVKKRGLFREQHVDEYWVVDLDARTFERSTPADARVDVLVEEIQWSPRGASTPLVIDVPRYFVRVLDT
ncbi:MAG TPA: Uma2 family endonuclease [Gemmatimonadaceae bacterium]